MKSNQFSLNLQSTSRVARGFVFIVFSLLGSLFGQEEEPVDLAVESDQDIAIIDVTPRAQLETPNSAAFLGVVGVAIGGLLAEHLQIEEGVVIQQVQEGSAASKAGLREHDVILTFDDLVMASPIDLRDAVQDCKVGDEVTVNLIRKGKKEIQVVMLEARPAGIAHLDPSLPGLGRLQQIWPQGGQGLGLLPKDAEEQIGHLREMIEEQFNGSGLGLKLNQLFNGKFTDGEGPVDVNIDAGSSVTWADGSGDVTMRMDNGQTEVEVRDSEGKIIFEGPWDNAQDKAAVAPEIRERIESMGIEKEGDQLKFRMEGFPGE